MKKFIALFNDQYYATAIIVTIAIAIMATVMFGDTVVAAVTGVTLF